MPALQTRFASQDVANQEDFFRLFQDVESSGDIFEIDSSLRAISVGSQSDLSSYCLFYYDQQANPSRQNVVDISVGNPFVARLNSLLDRQYPTVGNPAQLLVATRDLVDPGFLPRNFSTGPLDTIMRFPPKIDIIGHLAKPEGASPIRSNRVYNINGILSSASPSLWLVFPYYGRKQATVSVTNLTVAAPLGIPNFDVIGVRLGIGSTSLVPTQQRHTEIPLTGTPILVPPQTDRQVTTVASRDGQFDLLVVRFTDAAVAATDLLFMDVITSDTEG